MHGPTPEPIDEKSPVGTELHAPVFPHGGVDVVPMRTLFRQNRVVSSISAERNQRSIFEIVPGPDSDFLPQHLLQNLDIKDIARYLLVLHRPKWIVARK
jgi:hypothetical protein